MFGQSGGTWTQQTELTASDGGAPDNFGMSVAISDNTAVVGAPLHTVASSQQGAAYVFGLSTISFSPTYLNFGKQIFNETSVTRTVKVGNSGSGTLNISSITVSGDFAISANSCGSMLAVGEECFVGVTFTPTQLGARTGTLSFVDDAPKSPQTVPLLGTGIPPVALNRARVSFGKVKVGTTSVPRSFTMTNNQTVTLTGIVISTTGDFAVSSTTCGSTLGPKKKCAIRVTFTPTQTGTRTGQLQVHDSANNSPQTADLKGTGT